MERKQVNLRKETYERLRNYGKAGESFSDLIERILDEIERNDK